MTVRICKKKFTKLTKQDRILSEDQTVLGIPERQKIYDWINEQANIEKQTKYQQLDHEEAKRIIKLSQQLPRREFASWAVIGMVINSRFSGSRTKSCLWNQADNLNMNVESVSQL